MASNKGHSIKVRLLNASDHDNRRYQQLLVRYMQERFLYRLSHSPYRENFILKGGALLYAYDEFLPRPTLDVDFMGTRISNSKESIVNAFRDIAAVVPPENDGLRFIPESIVPSDIAVEKKYPGVRITLTVYLDTIRKELTFDIGFGDVIRPQPVIMEYPVVLGEMESPNLVAYSLETVVAEKFQTMIDKGEFNSRMKDFYDLYRIIIAHEFVAENLVSAITATFENRKTDVHLAAKVFTSAFADDLMINRRWKAYCNKTNIPGSLSFREVIKVIADFLTPYVNMIASANDDK